MAVIEAQRLKEGIHRKPHKLAGGGSVRGRPLKVTAVIFALAFQQK